MTEPGMNEQKEPVVITPVVITLTCLEPIFRALTNAIVALDAFNNRQNYGPAIQELIVALSDLNDSLLLDQPFSTEILSTACSDLCDQFAQRRLDVAEIVAGDLCLWPKTSTSEARRAFYLREYEDMYDPDWQPAAVDR
jgi:hypothetical protein